MSVPKEVAGRWSLKARRWAGGHSYEVWKQESANPQLIWSNVLDSRYLNDCFGDECSKTKLFLDRDRRPLSVRACGAEAEDLKLATAGLSSVGFRLPRLDDFKNAERDGIREVLQGLDDRIFWSSQLSPSLYLDVASVFYGTSGKIGIAYRHWRYSAICVAEESAQ